MLLRRNGNLRGGLSGELQGHPAVRRVSDAKPCVVHRSFLTHETRRRIEYH